MSERSERKWLSLREFRDAGYLQEVNRQFFHPLGLALVLELGENEAEDRIVGLWDYRDDPEGVIFAESNPPDQRMAKRIANEFTEKGSVRFNRFGWMIQPVNGIG